MRLSVCLFWSFRRPVQRCVNRAVKLLGAHKVAVLPISTVIIFNVGTVKQLSSTCAGDFTCATELWEATPLNLEDT
jgi:hypothetical protein